MQVSDCKNPLRVFISNICVQAPDIASAQELIARKFWKFGPITEVLYMISKNPTKGHRAFISFETEQGAANCIQNRNSFEETDRRELQGNLGGYLSVQYAFREDKQKEFSAKKRPREPNWHQRPCYPSEQKLHPMPFYHQQNPYYQEKLSYHMPVDQQQKQIYSQEKPVYQKPVFVRSFPTPSYQLKRETLHVAPNKQQLKEEILVVPQEETGQQMKETVAPQEQDGQQRGETEEEDTSPEKQESIDEEVDLDLLDFGGPSDDEEDNILSEILRN